jgi:hypothetical protein
MRVKEGIEEEGGEGVRGEEEKRGERTEISLIMRVVLM